jgi:hypothetical protein
MEEKELGIFFLHRGMEVAFCEARKRSRRKMRTDIGGGWKKKASEAATKAVVTYIFHFSSTLEKHFPPFCHFVILSFSHFSLPLHP